jgi:hypothetical protein
MVIPIDIFLFNIFRPFGYIKYLKIIIMRLVINRNIVHRIGMLAVYANFKVAVVSVRISGRAYISDNLPLCNGISCTYARLEQWAYKVAIPFPWSIITWFP